MTTWGPPSAPTARSNSNLSPCRRKSEAEKKLRNRIETPFSCSIFFQAATAGFGVFVVGGFLI